MIVETSRFSRAVVAAVLGCIATAVLTWFVFDPAGLTGTAKLAALGGCFSVVTVAAYLLITRLESALRERGYPVSRVVDAVYALATAGLLFGIGASLAYVPSSRVLTQALLLPATIAAGALAIALGVVTLDEDGVWESLSG